MTESLRESFPLLPREPLPQDAEELRREFHELLLRESGEAPPAFGEGPEKGASA